MRHCVICVHGAHLLRRERFVSTFDLDLMTESYRQLMISVSPPVILLDMDGCVVDWDKGMSHSLCSMSNERMNSCIHSCMHACIFV